MTHTRNNEGVCSKNTTVEIENGVITNVEITGGCNGNIKGLIALVKGMKAQDAIDKLKGIKCGMRKTSCPEQLAFALEEAIEK